MWKKAFVACTLLVASSLAFAIPTEQQVESAVKQGQYQEAETMMSEVVAARPQSAKAHYIYAELLAHNGRFAQASSEAAKARQLDPDIRFTDPAKFNAFEATLQREQSAPPKSRAASSGSSSTAMTAAPTRAPEPRSGGIPGWVWLAGLVVLAIVLWRGFARSRAASANGPTGMGPMGGGMPASYGPNGPAGGGGAGYGPAQGQGYGPGYGPGGAPMQRPGGGLLGTGLALGAGVAGGMLLDRALHGGHEGSGAIDPASAGAAGGMAGLGGLDPDSYAPTTDIAARELENRPVDFGNGDDWSSDGGGVDLGSGGGGDDWA